MQGGLGSQFFITTAGINTKCYSGIKMNCNLPNHRILLYFDQERQIMQF